MPHNYSHISTLLFTMTGCIKSTHENRAARVYLVRLTQAHSHKRFTAHCESHNAYEAHNRFNSHSPASRTIPSDQTLTSCVKPTQVN